MTERGAAAVDQSADYFRVGPSYLRWNSDNTLTVAIEEVGTPLPHRVRGEVQLTPDFINARRFTLDANARHHWRPIAPSARVEVNMGKPSLNWNGHAYFDTNAGAEPLEDGFTTWNWSRASLAGDTVILYDMQRRDRTPNALALRFDQHGDLHEFEAPADQPLPRTRWWRIARSTQADAGYSPRIVQTLEDTPFYARSVIDTQVLGQPHTAIHESLSLERFRTRWVQSLLTYRMPRRA